MAPIDGTPSNFIIKLTMLKVIIFSYNFIEKPLLSASSVLSQYTRVTYDRYTTSYDNSRTLKRNCNLWLKTKTGAQNHC